MENQNLSNHNFDEKTSAETIQMDVNDQTIDFAFGKSIPNIKLPVRLDLASKCLAFFED